MYREFFHLSASPFGPSPDPRFLYLTAPIREALAALIYGVNARKGFVLLTGEVGTGKTTIINKFLEVLRKQQARTACVLNPRMDVGELFDFILSDFGIVCPSPQKSKRLIQLQQWLLDLYNNRQHAVLIIDEAQQLSNEILEEIRFLTNLETPTAKLLHIVLAGQPELERKLADPGLRQLKQRIWFRCRTYPFTSDQTRDYITERLRIAGSNGEPIFTPTAVEAVHRHAGGVPRVINLLCEHALISSFVDKERPVPPKTIDFVAKELDLFVPSTAPGAPAPDHQGQGVAEVLRNYVAARR